MPHGREPGTPVNWQAVGAIGNVAGAIAVLATLIYLAGQLKQNTTFLRVNTANVVTQQLQLLFSLLTTDEGLAQIFIKAGTNHTLEGSDLVRFNSFTNNMLRVYENAHLQRAEGSIADAHWVGITRLMIDFTDMPAFAAYWNDRCHWVSDDFAAYMEAEIIPTPADRPMVQRDPR